MKKSLVSLIAIALFAVVFSSQAVVKAQSNITGKVHKHRNKVLNEYIVVFKDDERFHKIYEKAN